MRAGALLVLVALPLALAGCGGGGESTTENQGDVVFDLAEYDDSGLAGVRATLTDEGRDRTRFVIDGLDEGEPSGGGPNPVWLYRGTCDELDDVAQKLEPVAGSTSETNVDLGLGALMNGDYAIVVGLPEQEPETQAVACGEIPSAA